MYLYIYTHKFISIYSTHAVRVECLEILYKTLRDSESVRWEMNGDLAEALRAKDGIKRHLPVGEVWSSNDSWPTLHVNREYGVLRYSMIHI